MCMCVMGVGCVIFKTAGQSVSVYDQHRQQLSVGEALRRNITQHQHTDRRGANKCKPAHLHITLESSTQPNSNATMRNRRSAAEDCSAASRRQQREEVVPSDYCKNITQACVVCTSPLCKSAGARCSQSREGKGR